ncbi:DNA-directed RNA polymerase subunit B'' [Candidatus Micrarchaeota archaeon CG09_land_8_20_14_0_10_60_16]|nr:MAG: DNA-directed RNA polymerase subunit B'' [Candidatus Micrarchaeota archaeon CG09_land_8_20_14_0_10_60_16]
MYSELTKEYLRSNGLVKQHILSFDNFVDGGMQKIADAIGVIEPNVENYQIKLGKIRVEKPTVVEADGSRHPLNPMEARQRDLSYSAPLYLEMTCIIKGVDRKPEDVFIGELPIMLKSKLCYLHGKTQQELVEMGEDPIDSGAYFIINGTEKSLMTLEDLAPNRILVSREKDKDAVQAKVFSTRAGFRGRCTVDRNNEGKLGVTLPSYNRPLEMMMILRALGVSSDERILEAFAEEKEVRNDILLNLELDESKNKPNALEIIGKRAAPGQPLDYQIKRAELLVDRYLLPHIGVDPKDRIAKAYYLCRMAERSILVAAKKRGVEDKDHYANKRMKIGGKLMEELFRQAFQFFVKDVAYQTERANVRGRRMSLFAIVRPDALTDRIKYSMATGTWVGGHTGVCQVLDRYNHTSAISFIRRVTSPLAKKHPHYKARDLHGTHWGRLDPNETPEGPNCGLIRNMALFAEVTTGDDEAKMEREIKKMGVSMNL